MPKMFKTYCITWNELMQDTHSIAGGQEVDYVVIKLCHMIAYVQLGVFVSGARIFLSHVHPQD